MTGGLGFTKQTENQLKQNRSLLSNKNRTIQKSFDTTPQTKEQLVEKNKLRIHNQKVTRKHFIKLIITISIITLITCYILFFIVS